MVGPTDEAKAARELLAQSLNVALSGPQLEWTEVCRISHETALAALGERPREHVRPWLVGLEAEKDRLDAEYTSALAARRAARTQGQVALAAATAALKTAKLNRRRSLRQWEQ